LVDELLNLAVERPALHQVKVDIGRTSKTRSSPVRPVTTTVVEMTVAGRR